jgi:hypothetical protein
MSDKDIPAAFRSFLTCLEPGGGLLITVRDYEKESRERLQFRPYGIREKDGKRYVAFQTWEFADLDPDIYTVSMFFVEDDGSSNAPTKVMRTKYRMITVSRLIELMKEAGFENVARVSQDGGFYQPVIVGTKSL